MPDQAFNLESPPRPRGIASRGLAIAAMMLTALIWGGWAVVSHLGVNTSLTTGDIIVVRFATSAIILLPLLWRRWRLPMLWHGPFLALTCGFGYLWLAINGMKYAPAMHASIFICSTTMIFALLINRVIFNERPSTSRIWGMGFILGGLGLIALAIPVNATALLWVGHLYFIIAGGAWALYMTAVKIWRYDAWLATAQVAFFSALFYLPFYGLVGTSHLLIAPWQDIALQAVYQGIITAIIALVCFTYGVSVLGLLGSAITTALAPVFAQLIAIPVLNEWPTVQEIGGMLLACAGIPLALHKPAPTTRKKDDHAYSHAASQIT